MAGRPSPPGRFVAAAIATRHQEVIAAAVEAYSEALQRRFPGLAETEPYPVLSGLL